MSNLLTRDGRIPKRKWVVLPRSGNKVLSSHQYKSSAMDRAITLAYKNDAVYVVGEIGFERNGKPAIFEVWIAHKTH